MVAQVLRRVAKKRGASTHYPGEGRGGGVRRTRVMISRSRRCAIPFARLLQFCLLPNKPCRTMTGAWEEEDDDDKGAACFSDESRTGSGVAGSV